MRLKIGLKTLTSIIIGIVVLIVGATCVSVTLTTTTKTLEKISKSWAKSIGRSVASQTLAVFQRYEDALLTPSNFAKVYAPMMPRDLASCRSQNWTDSWVPFLVQQASSLDYKFAVITVIFEDMYWIYSAGSQIDPSASYVNWFEAYVPSLPSTSGGFRYYRDNATLHLPKYDGRTNFTSEGQFFGVNPRPSTRSSYDVSRKILEQLQAVYIKDSTKPACFWVPMYFSYEPERNVFWQQFAACQVKNSSGFTIAHNFISVESEFQLGEVLQGASRSANSQVFVIDAGGYLVSTTVTGVRFWTGTVLSEKYVQNTDMPLPLAPNGCAISVPKNTALHGEHFRLGCRALYNNYSGYGGPLRQLSLAFVTTGTEEFAFVDAHGVGADDDETFAVFSKRITTRVGRLPLNILVVVPASDVRLGMIKRSIGLAVGLAVAVLAIAITVTSVTLHALLRRLEEIQLKMIMAAELQHLDEVLDDSANDSDDEDDDDVAADDDVVDVHDGHPDENFEGVHTMPQSTKLLRARRTRRRRMDFDEAEDAILSMMKTKMLILKHERLRLKQKHREELKRGGLVDRNEKDDDISEAGGEEDTTASTAIDSTNSGTRRGPGGRNSGKRNKISYRNFSKKYFRFARVFDGKEDLEQGEKRRARDVFSGKTQEQHQQQQQQQQQQVKMTSKQPVGGATAAATTTAAVVVNSKNLAALNQQEGGIYNVVDDDANDFDHHENGHDENLLDDRSGSIDSSVSSSSSTDDDKNDGDEDEDEHDGQDGLMRKMMMKSKIGIPSGSSSSRGVGTGFENAFLKLKRQQQRSEEYYHNLYSRRSSGGTATKSNDKAKNHHCPRDTTEKDGASLSQEQRLVNHSEHVRKQLQSPSPFTSRLDLNHNSFNNNNNNNNSNNYNFFQKKLSDERDHQHIDQDDDYQHPHQPFSSGQHGEPTTSTSTDDAAALLRLQQQQQQHLLLTAERGDNAHYDNNTSNSTFTFQRQNSEGQASNPFLNYSNCHQHDQSKNLRIIHVNNNNSNNNATSSSRNAAAAHASSNAPINSASPRHHNIASSISTTGDSNALHAIISAVKSPTAAAAAAATATTNVSIATAAATTTCASKNPSLTQHPLFAQQQQQQQLQYHQWDPLRAEPRHHRHPLQHQQHQSRRQKQCSPEEELFNMMRSVNHIVPVKKLDEVVDDDDDDDGSCQLQGDSNRKVVIVADHNNININNHNHNHNHSHNNNNNNNDYYHSSHKLGSQQRQQQQQSSFIVPATALQALLTGDGAGNGSSCVAAEQNRTLSASKIIITTAAATCDQTVMVDAPNNNNNHHRRQLSSPLPLHNAGLGLVNKYSQSGPDAAVVDTVVHGRRVVEIVASAQQQQQPEHGQQQQQRGGDREDRLGIRNFSEILTAESSGGEGSFQVKAAAESGKWQVQNQQQQQNQSREHHSSLSAQTALDSDQAVNNIAATIDQTDNVLHANNNNNNNSNDNNNVNSTNVALENNNDNNSNNYNNNVDINVDDTYQRSFDHSADRVAVASSVVETFSMDRQHLSSNNLVLRRGKRGELVMAPPGVKVSSYLAEQKKLRKQERLLRKQIKFEELERQRKEERRLRFSHAKVPPSFAAEPSLGRVFNFFGGGGGDVGVGTVGAGSGGGGGGVSSGNTFGTRNVVNVGGRRSLVNLQQYLDHASSNKRKPSLSVANNDDNDNDNKNDNDNNNNNNNNNNNDYYEDKSNFNSKTSNHINSNSVQKQKNRSWISEIAAVEEAYEATLRNLTNFTRYVSKAVVRELISRKQHAGVDDSKRGLPAMKVVDEVTVSFVEINNFSNLWLQQQQQQRQMMSEQHFHDEDLLQQQQRHIFTSILHIYFKRMCRLIMGHGGIVDKFLADSIMSYWGAPNPTKYHALLAALCSLALQRESRRDPLRRLFNKALDQELSVRIGVSSGTCVVGTVGGGSGSGDDDGGSTNEHNFPRSCSSSPPPPPPFPRSHFASAEREEDDDGCCNTRQSDFLSYTILGQPVYLARNLLDFGQQWKIGCLIDVNCARRCFDTLHLRLLANTKLRRHTKPVLVYELCGVDPESQLLRKFALVKTVTRNILVRRKPTQSSSPRVPLSASSPTKQIDDENRGACIQLSHKGASARQGSDQNSASKYDDDEEGNGDGEYCCDDYIVARDATVIDVREDQTIALSEALDVATLNSTKFGASFDKKTAGTNSPILANHQEEQQQQRFGSAAANGISLSVHQGTNEGTISSPLAGSHSLFPHRQHQQRQPEQQKITHAMFGPSSSFTGKTANMASAPPPHYPRPAAVRSTNNDFNCQISKSQEEQNTKLAVSLLRWHLTRTSITSAPIIKFIERFSDAARDCIDCHFSECARKLEAIESDPLIPLELKREFSVLHLYEIAQTYCDDGDDHDDDDDDGDGDDDGEDEEEVRGSRNLRNRTTTARNEHENEGKLEDGDKRNSNMPSKRLSRTASPKIPSLVGDAATRNLTTTTMQQQLSDGDGADTIDQKRVRQQPPPNMIVDGCFVVRAFTS